MKLHRYKQFVDKINEEREMPKYDTPDEFRRVMADDFEETEEVLDRPGSEDYGTYEDDVDDYGDTDYDYDTEVVEEPSQPEDDIDYDPNQQPGIIDEPAEDSEPLDDESTPYSGPDMLQELANLLGVQVVDEYNDRETFEEKGHVVVYKGTVVNYYSETGKLHIEGVAKPFDTAQEAAEYLKKNSTRPRVADDFKMDMEKNESRSYRFKRKSRF